MDKKILFFDGVCHLCNSYINFLIKFKSKNLLYAPLQGVTASRLLQPDQIQKLDSLIYYKNGQVLEKSEAVIESLSDAFKMFSIFKIFYIIPKALRNAIYDYVARNRYRFFGQRETCRIPSPEEKLYILD